MFTSSNGGCNTSKSWCAEDQDTGNISASYRWYMLYHLWPWSSESSAWVNSAWMCSTAALFLAAWPYPCILVAYQIFGPRDNSLFSNELSYHSKSFFSLNELQSTFVTYGNASKDENSNAISPLNSPAFPLKVKHTVSLLICLWSVVS